MAPLVEEVEQLRGLEFDHPVPVKVLDSTTFDERFTENQTPTERDLEEWAESEAALRALGLLEAPVDLESLTAGMGAQVLGFYDPQRKRIVVRGDTFSDPATRTTLVHELTHALQDQEFDLKAIRRKETRADASSVTALVEGDATRIEELYADGLSERDRADAEASDSSIAGVVPDLPPIVEVMVGSEYSLGYLMTQVLATSGGERAVNRAFRDPPLNDLAIIDPVALLDGTSAIAVDAPELGPGDRPLGDPTRMGATMLYFVLASHLPAADALGIAERLGGDSSIAFTRDGTTQCVVSVMVGRDGATDTETLAAGLDRWNAAARANAEITRDGMQVTLTSCAPSTPDDVSEAALSQALFYVLLRNSFATGALTGTGIRTAKCIADGVMALAPAAQAVASVRTPDDDLPEDMQATLIEAVQENAARLRSQCRDAG